MMAKVKRALVSVTDKTGIEDFARGLIKMDVEILSTGGTAKLLVSKGLKVTEVSNYTGFPEMMDGRVKTLHPKVHGGILHLRDNPTHVAELNKHGMKPIDMVVVNLYRFEETVAKENVTVEDAVENIDIGGPSMIRSAAKNHKFVAVVTSPAWYKAILTEMEATGGSLSENTMRKLACDAFRLTSSYDGAIHTYLNGLVDKSQFPQTLRLNYRKLDELRYGENPHQKAAFYADDTFEGACVARTEKLGGKELSYNNILDLDSAFGLVMEFENPSVVVIKHNNPCGGATAVKLADALVRAMDGDRVSAFGGIFALNRAVDTETATLIAKPENFVEAIIAPDYAPGAVEILAGGAKWGKNLRILKTGTAPGSAPKRRFDLRAVRGGMLCQTPDDAVLAADGFKIMTSKPTDEQLRDLIFGWRVAKHVKSNAIVLAKNEMVVGVGAGQMSRVDSSWMAARKAGDRAKGSVVASDAFFPFKDALEVALDAGATAAIEPGGSARDEEVIELARQRNVPLVFTGMRHFRH
ncbi:MAG: bifunctional phosphoribosylaminoimidazolecarboxamide formyltransferase/IMP cyclohydrolase [Planctomycetota bacterium]|nr:bifunctional phosphoribosylaminoimidazolecarboxamide formyltransferase/IMP cyclohydrolase [Planctomycetota bacterium]